MDWYSKKQGTVESSTFTAEYLAGRTTTDQVIDMRNTLRYMGVPLGRTVVFGDNQSVITNSTIPQSQLQKRHAALSYHRVREAISAGIFQLYHINGCDNPSDVLSKHWGYSQVWKLLQPILFWDGDTGKLLEKDTPKDDESDDHKSEE